MIPRTTCRACLVVVVALCTTAAARADDLYKVGLARIKITPDEMTWLSGYSRRTAPAESVAQDLFAKAAAFQSPDGTRLVLVTLDLGSVSPHMTDTVATGAKQRYDLPRESLILNCSHTHSAPEVSAERRIILDYPDEEETKLARYIEKLLPRLVDLVGAALADLRPARLSYSHASADFAFNRRHPSGIDRDGVTDRQVPVLRIAEPAGGKLRGVLFGYACHNTTLDFQQFCGDYAGYAQQYLEEAHPGAMALFVMGCGGDQNPQPRHGADGLQHAQRHGRTLADAVEAALAGEQREVGTPLRIAYDVASLELEPLPPIESLRADAAGKPGHAKRKADYLLGLIDAGKEVPLTQPCPLHVARFGDDLLMVFLSGETVVDYSLRCKSDFDGKAAVWVAGYCDDVFAYLPSRRVLLEGGYEGRTGIVHQFTATPFLPTVEQRVMQTVEKLVRQVSGEKTAGRAPAER